MWTYVVAALAAAAAVWQVALRPRPTAADQAKIAHATRRSAAANERIAALNAAEKLSEKSASSSSSSSSSSDSGSSSSSSAAAAAAPAAAAGAGDRFCPYNTALQNQVAAKVKAAQAAGHGADAVAVAAYRKDAAAAADADQNTGGPSLEVPKVCLVTGGTGFVGLRLVEMLVERGAEEVRCFDVVPKPAGRAWDHPAIKWIVGDIRDAEAVAAAVRGVDCVWHLAAAVGPFHPMPLYDAVNHRGCINVVDACRRHGVRKIVMSSSPSTRFDGSDVDGLTEDQMPPLPLDRYLQTYAESKANGEMHVSKACLDDIAAGKTDDALLTVSVAPHQVYGPRDTLFLPNVMEAAGNNKLRVIAAGRTGSGFNRICLTYVDNYVHGLILAEKALYLGSPALGKFYICTDGTTHPFEEGYAYFWVMLDEAARFLGFISPFTRMKLFTWFMYPVGALGEIVGDLLGTKFKMNKFTVTAITMHRWFKIDAAVKDLGYAPIIPYDDGWADTLIWFKHNWLPTFKKETSILGISDASQAKIDTQAAGTEVTRGK